MFLVLVDVFLNFFLLYLQFTCRAGNGDLGIAISLDGLIAENHPRERNSNKNGNSAGINFII